MLKYYWTLFRRLPGIFREMKDGARSWVYIFLSALAVSSLELAKAVRAHTGSR